MFYFLLYCIVGLLVFIIDTFVDTEWYKHYVHTIWGFIVTVLITTLLFPLVVLAWTFELDCLKKNRKFWWNKEK